MKLVDQDTEPVVLQRPIVAQGMAMGRQFKRSAGWETEDTMIFVDAIAFVTGIRARRNEDGSVDLLDTTSPYTTLNANEFVQHVERALFIWQKWAKDERSEWVKVEEDTDYSNEIGLVYAKDLKAAEEQCKLFIKNLDFTTQFDPPASTEPCTTLTSARSSTWSIPTSPPRGDSPRKGTSGPSSGSNSTPAGGQWSEKTGQVWPGPPWSAWAGTPGRRPRT